MCTFCYNKSFKHIDCVPITSLPFWNVHSVIIIAEEYQLPGQIIPLLGKRAILIPFYLKYEHDSIKASLQYLEIRQTPVNDSDNCFALYILATQSKALQTSVMQTISSHNKVDGDQESCGSIVTWSTAPGTRRDFLIWAKGRKKLMTMQRYKTILIINGWQMVHKYV